MAVLRPLIRPVHIADFNDPQSRKKSATSPTGEEALEDISGLPFEQRRIRHAFPLAEEEGFDGKSDGYCFTIVFSGGRYATSYGLVLAFLKEHGYGNVPVPKDAEELKRFRLPPRFRHQLGLFGDDGYVHNPIKILFPSPGSKPGSLTLEIYNESAEDHLLRFHRRK